MVQNIKTFKSSSALKFEGIPSDDTVMLSSAGRGDVFIREGAVCMRVEQCDEVKLPPWKQDAATPWKHHYAIVNLQTGRVWFSPDTPIRYIKATVVLETE